MQDLGLNFISLLIGIISFVVIGAFHPIVIKCEYHFSKRAWPVFLVVGLLLAVVAVLVKNLLLSVAISLTAFSCLWSIRELFEQEERVIKGWFPENPMRAAEYAKLREVYAKKQGGKH